MKLGVSLSVALWNAWADDGSPEGDPADEGDPIEVEDLFYWTEAN